MNHWCPPPVPPAILHRLSFCANVASLITIASPLVTLSHFVSAGQVGKESPLPYFMFFAQAWLWVCYGHLESLPEIVKINGVATIVGGVFLAAFSYYANPGQRFLTRVLLLGGIATVFLFSFVCMVGLKDLPLMRVQVIAWTAIVFSTMICVTPMAQLVGMLRERSLEGFPLCLTVSGFISAALWAEYSYLTCSAPYLIPNAIGFVLNFCQLAAVCWIKAKQEEKKESFGSVINCSPSVEEQNARLHSFFGKKRKGSSVSSTVGGEGEEGEGEGEESDSESTTALVNSWWENYKTPRRSLSGIDELVGADFLTSKGIYGTV